jgi:hypothetical protein
MAVREKKRVPVEVEHLTNEERFDKFKDRPAEEVVVWLNLVCDALVRVEELVRLNQNFQDE